MGDVVMTTPVTARLRYVTGPSAIIDVDTHHKHIFAGNPHVNKVDTDLPAGPYDLVINLNDAYERRRHLHSIDAYMIEAFGDARWPTKSIVVSKRALPPGLEIDWQRAVTLHPANTDRNRTIPPATWEQLIRKLRTADLIPVILGSYRELRLFEADGAIDLTGKLDLPQTAMAIQRSACFVSADTGLTHVAGSTETPMVSIYTAVLPQHRMPWRHGILGWRVTSLLPDVDCIGCLSGPGCKRGDFACVEGVEAVSADRILQAVMNWVYATEPLT